MLKIIKPFHFPWVLLSEKKKVISFSLEGRKMTCFICYSSGRENLWNLKASDACLSSPACPLHQGTLPSHLECTSSGCCLSLPRLYSRKAVSHSLCWLVGRGKLLSRCWLKGPRSRCSAFQFKFSGALIAYPQRACVSPEGTNAATQHSHCLSEPLCRNIELHPTALKAVNLWRLTFDPRQILIAFWYKSTGGQFWMTW